MNTVKRITKNTVVLFSANIIGKLFGFFFTMYTARYLGADGFGILSFAVAFTGLFSMFADFGLYELVIREVARNKELANKYTKNCLVIKLIMSFFAFVLIFLAINVMGYPDTTKLVVYVLGVSVVLDAFTMLFNCIFQAFEQMEYVSVGKILRSLTLLIGALVVIFGNTDILGFAGVYLISSIFELLFSLFLIVKRFGLGGIEFDMGFCKGIVKESLPFWLSSVFWVIYFRIDSVMLSFMVDDSAVGFYNAAFQLVHALSFIQSAFLAAIFPVTSCLYKTSIPSLKIAFERSFKYLALIIMPIAVGTTLLADKFILLIYDSEFTSSIIVLQLLVWAEVLIFLNVSLINLLNSINKQKEVTLIAIVLAVLNISLNLFLIPSYSFIGASIATILTELCAFLLLFFRVQITQCKVSAKFIAVLIFRIFAASLFMGCFVYIFRGLPLVLVIFLSILVYMFGVYFTNCLDMRDKNLLAKLLRSTRLE